MSIAWEIKWILAIIRVIKQCFNWNHKKKLVNRKVLLTYGFGYMCLCVCKSEPESMIMILENDFEEFFLHDIIDFFMGFYEFKKINRKKMSFSHQILRWTSRITVDKWLYIDRKTLILLISIKKTLFFGRQRWCCCRNWSSVIAIGKLI